MRSLALVLLAFPTFPLLSPLLAPGIAASAPSLVREEDDTPLMKEMEKLDAAMELLKRSVLDPAQDAKSLEQLAIAQQACVASKSMVPKMAEKTPVAERAGFVTSYRKGMVAVLVELANLEAAVLDGDRERARSLWKKLDGMKDEGHNTFTEGE